MNNVNTLASLMIGGLKSVQVKFKNYDKKYYTYKTLLDFEVGDFAIVDVGYEFKVVEIIRVDKIPNLNVDSNIEYKWIVQKLDTEPYEYILAMEEETSHKLRELQQKNVVSKARELMAEILSVDKEDIEVALND